MGWGLVGAGCVWAASMVHWLAWGYMLEFEGLPVHLPLWVASVAFLGANALLAAQLVRALYSSKRVAPAVPAAPARSTSAGRRGGLGGASGSSGSGGGGGGGGGVCMLSFLDASLLAAWEPAPSPTGAPGGGGGRKLHNE
ncbi:hypothetical protein FOA52_010663 [Chlamydomonas sp. UWO 241]|nr:hypothetical protein FOA52_010663 [Chlamydomonas sp. UWO 241]